MPARPARSASRRSKRSAANSIANRATCSIIARTEIVAPTRADRHSVLAVCQWRLFALPVLTYLEYAALRVTKNHHFRLAIFCMSIGPRKDRRQEKILANVTQAYGPPVRGPKPASFSPGVDRKGTRL